jgi:short-subunit dehydrogenase
VSDDIAETVYEEDLDVPPVAVVTGGSAGIGLATAQRLAQEGWSVAIIARDEARLEQARDIIDHSGEGRVLAISADVSDADAVHAAADRIEAELGPIEVWVNNAMSTVIGSADQITPAEYRRVTETTYLSQVFGTLAALRHMKPRNRGTIIQVSSALAIRAVPLQAPYAAAKFAVSGFTDALRAELIADDVDVALSVVYLPSVNTPQFSWSRNHTGRRQVPPEPVFDARLCAEAILDVAEKPTREVWVGRTSVLMSLAQRFAPGWADRKASASGEAQLGEEIGVKEGNLEVAQPGPALIDGLFSSKVQRTRNEYVTSRSRSTAKVLCAGAFAALCIAAVRRR